MKKPRRIFYVKETPANAEIDISKAKPVSDKEFHDLLKRSAERHITKKKSKKRAA
jgi:hypothetical protein